MTTSYDEFVASKALVSLPTGIANPPELSPKLKEHQTLLTQWALRRGRAAIFADTGLGKGFMILEWARVVAEHTAKPVLILAPLAVSQQFVREAQKLGVCVTLCADQIDVRPGINVTNYQKLHKFEIESFGGVALDEASILKAKDGATCMMLIDRFREIPFRLAATATPSPNDYTELGTQAEFLGVMTNAEMLASFFIRDGGKTQDFRLKGHGREIFWRWVCSWGAIIKMPSDIGCSDEGYVLPPLCHHEHIIPASIHDAHASGKLFPEPAESMHDQRAARRGTLDARVAKAAEIANATRGQCLVWCDLNPESKALTKSIDGAIEITGSMSADDKEAAIEAFVSGRARVAVSKAKLMGFGLNLQFAKTVIFCGVTHSFEAYYQAVRRSWRYPADGEVNVHIVSSELEGAVVANLKRKTEAAEELSNETRRYVSRYVRDAVTSLKRETISYNPTQKAQWPSWLRTEVA